MRALFSVKRMVPVHPIEFQALSTVCSVDAEVVME